jgi:PAS domain S-box-containing protein/putative nucleotidyltransferase with HDIG domain
VRGIQVVSTDITERKLAEQELRESEERFNKAFHSNPAMSTIAAPDGRIIDANDAWLRGFGFLREEVLGHATEDLGVIEPGGRHVLVDLAGRPDRGSVELHVWTKNGEPRTVLVRSEYVDLKGQRCLLSTAMDITERKAMEDSLLLTKFSLDHAAEAILWFDVAGVIQYANEHSEKLFGYSQEEFAHLTVYDLDPDQTREAWVSQWETLKRDGGMTFSVRPQKSTGERFYGEVTITYLLHAGSEQNIAVLRDVTDRHLAAEALRASKERLHHMFESMSSGVVVCEAVESGGFDLVIREINRAGEQVTRVLRTSCVGRSFAEVFPGARAMGLYDLMQNVWHTGEPEALEGRRYEDERASFWIENYVYKLPSGEIVVMFDDVSEKQQALADLQDAYGRLRTTQAGTLEALAAVVEFRDPYTAGHQERVAKIALMIGKKMGMSPHELEGLQHAAIVHDVGKIAVPIEILSSPGRLSELQHTLVRQHVESGYEILRPIEFDWPIADIVRQHHERLDGRGYPLGLKGEEILLEARIIAVADTAEAMISHRPYRPALGVEAAREELTANAGVIYDANVVQILLELDLDAVARENEEHARHVNFWSGPPGR